MSCENRSGCENKSHCLGKLCPVSFGAAVGLTFGLMVFIWTLWVLAFGMPVYMMGMHLAPLTVGGGLWHAVCAVGKGFVVGFFIALFYDLFICCGMKWGKKCCGGNGSSCEKKEENKLQ